MRTLGPIERPSSSPRPDIGEVYADGVLLVWKPVESCGPVTYIVQCSMEGICPGLCRDPRALVCGGGGGGPRKQALFLPLCVLWMWSGSLGLRSPTPLCSRWQLEHAGHRHL